MKHTQEVFTGLRYAVGNLSECRYMSDCISWGHEFKLDDPGAVPYFSGDHEIISMAVLLPSAESRIVVSYKRKYVHKVLVNCLVKLAQEKLWLGELTILTRP